MGYKTIYVPPAKIKKHKCDLPYAHWNDAPIKVGTIVQCNCGQKWKAKLFLWRKIK